MYRSTVYSSVGHLYIMQMALTGDVKIGRSSDPERRRAQLQTGCPHEIRILLVIQDGGSKEKDLHRLLAHRSTRARGEWFSEDALSDLPLDVYERLNLDEIDWWRPRPETTRLGRR